MKDGLSGGLLCNIGFLVCGANGAELQGRSNAMFSLMQYAEAEKDSDPATYKKVATVMKNYFLCQKKMMAITPIAGWAAARWIDMVRKIRNNPLLGKHAYTQTRLFYAFCGGMARHSRWLGSSTSRASLLRPRPPSCSSSASFSTRRCVW